MSIKKIIPPCQQLNLLYTITPYLPSTLTNILFRIFWNKYWKEERKKELLFAPDPPPEEIVNSERAIFIEQVFGKKKPERILEIGFGYGQNLGIIKELAPEITYVGIELDFERIQGTKHHYSKGFFHNLELIQGDIRNISLKDNSFETVIVSAVLLYLSGKDVKQALKEIFRVTKNRIIILEQATEKLEELILPYPDGENKYYIRNYAKEISEICPGACSQKIEIPNKRWLSESWKDYAEVLIVNKMKLI